MMLILRILHNYMVTIPMLIIVMMVCLPPQKDAATAPTISTLMTISVGEHVKLNSSFNCSIAPEIIPIIRLQAGNVYPLYTTEASCMMKVSYNNQDREFKAF